MDSYKYVYFASGFVSKVGGKVAGDYFVDIALATGHYPLHEHNETLIYGTFVLIHIKHTT